MPFHPGGQVLEIGDGHLLARGVAVDRLARKAGRCIVPRRGRYSFGVQERHGCAGGSAHIDVLLAGHFDQSADILAQIDFFVRPADVDVDGGVGKMLLRHVYDLSHLPGEPLVIPGDEIQPVTGVGDVLGIVEIFEGREGRPPCGIESSNARVFGPHGSLEMSAGGSLVHPESRLHILHRERRNWPLLRDMRFPRNHRASRCAGCRSCPRSRAALRRKGGHRRPASGVRRWRAPGFRGRSRHCRRERISNRPLPMPAGSGSRDKG